MSAVMELSIEILPNELLFEIFSYLTPASVIRVSRRWHQICLQAHKHIFNIYNATRDDYNLSIRIAKIAYTHRLMEQLKSIISSLRSVGKILATIFGPLDNIEIRCEFTDNPLIFTLSADPYSYNYTRTELTSFRFKHRESVYNSNTIKKLLCSAYNNIPNTVVNLLMQFIRVAKFLAIRLQERRLEGNPINTSHHML